MSQFRIMDTNRVFASTTTITSSSNNTSFPDDNLQLYSRARTWRTTGNFVIDSTNNKIDFDEGGGELNATITSATYTPTTLAAEIKTQLESTGSETYTVTFNSSTGLWNISHANDGGSLSILWKTGTNGSDNTDTHIGTTLGYADTADDTGATPSTGYTGDNIALHTEEWAVFDLGSALAVDSVALLYDPVIGATLSSTATVKIQANSSDSWSSPSVDITLTLDAQDNVFTHFFSSDQAYRYWRLYLVDVDNTNGYLEIPKLILSKATQLTQVPEIGFQYTLSDQSQIKKTEFGHQYADVFPKLRRMSFAYKNMLYSDLETLIDIFSSVGKTQPITISVDPLETLFDKDRFFIYGVISTDFSATHVVTNIFDHGFNVDEII